MDPRDPPNIEDAAGAEGIHSVAIVGAGAAGLLAAIFARRAGAEVLLLETRARPGAKIRVSGGGRCNVLPSQAELDDFASSGSRNAVRNVLRSWPLDRVRAFFEAELGIPLKVEATGKVFPASDQARDVVDGLLGECGRLGVRLVEEFRVTQLTPCAGGFVLEGADGRRVTARRVVLASGGLSLPRTGSDGAGLRFARALGHHLEVDHPALVPLLSDETRLTTLAGLSLPVELRACRGQKVMECRGGDFLFTHRGFSGPVVLDISRHVTSPVAGGVEVRVAWRGADAPDWDALLRQGGTRQVSTVLRDELPRRLADALIEIANVSAEKKLSTLSREERKRLVEGLSDYPLPIAGDEGYATAEVTAGGVPLGELYLKTLESRLVPGLHFAGEILDVVGHIGGYNFLWAWVTGRKAGEGAAGALPGPSVESDG